MRLLIDANIVLDVLQKREPHYQNSALVWKLCEIGKCDGFVSSLTFTNIVYIMRQELSSKQINNLLRQLMLIFNFVDLSVADVANAAGRDWDDFEDAIQSVTAERVKANFIITRNVKDFVDSQVVALTPEELLSRI